MSGASQGVAVAGSVLCATQTGAPGDVPRLARWRILPLAWSQFFREWRAGELRLALFALMLAVAACTAVGLLQSRVLLALDQGAATLSAADLTLVGDAPPTPAWLTLADGQGLQHSTVAVFPSMLRGPTHAILASIKAVDGRFPLRGLLRVDQKAAPAPAPGTCYLARGLAARLGLQSGQPLRLGHLALQVAGVIDDEPDGGMASLRAAPRVMVNLADLDASGLVRPGARISWRLGLAGSRGALAAWRHQVQPALVPGQRLESAADGRPEVRRVIDQAAQFLQLSALASVLLAAVALAFALQRHWRRQRAVVALMRCLGTPRDLVVALQVGCLACLGGVGALAGLLSGALLQFALAAVVAPLVGVPLPAPDLWPLLQGLAIAAVLLPGLALPGLLDLMGVSGLQLLRDPASTGARPWQRWLVWLLAPLSLALVAWLAVGSLTLASLALLALTATGLAAAGLAFVLLALVQRTLPWLPMLWRHALRSLQRRPGFTSLQAGAVAIGIAVLLVLGLVRQDLLATWQASLPADAPNHFLLGVQADERPALAQFMVAHGQPPLVLRPLVRARLTAIDGRTAQPADFKDPQARALLDREANLSWAAEPNPDNRLVAGQWWPQAPADAGLSLERGFADHLGLHVGSLLRFDVAGVPFESRVASIRTVRWDSFQPNFFVLVRPGLLDGQSVSYLGSFRISPDDTRLADALVDAFPQTTLIDTGALIQQVRSLTDQVVLAIELVFAFSLLAGLAVLLAGLGATHDERLREGALLRALGATRAQLSRLQSIEFSLLGLAAGLAAAVAALAVSYAASTFWLDLPWHPDLRIPVLGGLAGVVLVRVSAAWSLRGLSRDLPAASLRLLR